MSIYRVARSVYHVLPEPVRDALSRSPLEALRRRVIASLPSHDERYNADYYSFIDQTTARSAPAMARTIVREVSPRRVVDVGCGTGALLSALTEQGVDGEGLEYSVAGLKYCHERGLKVHRFDLETDRPPPLTPPYDTVISMEVAEHLPASLADRFVSLLVSLGPVVVFTAATPGQGGTDHVNEQPHQYWIDRFEALNYTFDSTASDRWRAEWSPVDDIAWWFKRNLMLFRRRPVRGD